jgi:hypothetical protein
VIKLNESGVSTAEGWDDEITFNTQVASFAPIGIDEINLLNRNLRNGIAWCTGKV